MVSYFKIETVDVDGHVPADGVMVNSDGAWLGEWDIVRYPTGAEQTVLPYADEDGEYIPAPAHWRDLIREA